MKFGIYHKFYLVIITGSILFNSCNKEKVGNEYKPSNAHEIYVQSLKTANLQKTVLFKRFVQVSDEALTDAIKIPIPYQEVFYMDKSDPDAAGYRFELKRGQKIKIKSSLISKDSLQLFMDVFRIRDSLNTSWYHVASAMQDSLYIEFIARLNAEYILRIQPELLCDIKCKIEIQVESSLLFPVIGKDRSSIQSFFGDPRDGGRREHQGVDIFAARHTHIIASADGYVGRTANSGMGGKHVWIYYPSIGINCYYAHLEDIIAKTGKKIKAGDIIGTVGNSGNAKYTPPHLHFGIYRRGYGATDPYYFIATEPKKAKEIADRYEILGALVRTNKPDTKLLLNDDDIYLPENTGFKIYAFNSDKVRVELPTGIKGYISVMDIEMQDNPIKQLKTNSICQIYNSPIEGALVIKELSAKNEINIYSEFNNFLFVQLKSGEKGWIKQNEII